MNLGARVLGSGEMIEIINAEGITMVITGIIEFGLIVTENLTLT